jgi:hypothetical protein
MGRSSACVCFDGPRRVGEDLLLHEADPGTAGNGDISRVGRFEAGRDAQQSRLPHPIRTDKPDTVAVSQTERHIAEHEALAKTLRERLH